MTKKKRKKPRRNTQSKVRSSREGIETREQTLLLDRFTTDDLTRWKKFGSGLDSYHYNLYFSLEAQRAATHDELIEALLNTDIVECEIRGWVRIVDYEFSNQPLSARGSLRQVGGRFNIGSRIDPQRFAPFPAFYFASDEETARSEKFSTSRKKIEGLEREEFALPYGRSHSTIFLNGKLQNIFDLTTPKNLKNFIDIVKDYKIPKNVSQLAEGLGLQPMITATEPKQLFQTIMMENWRYFPVQHSVPSNSQIIATLIKAAGFEGIIFKSIPGSGKCIALFPEALEKSESFVALQDRAPNEDTITRLDSETWPRLL